MSWFECAICDNKRLPWKSMCSECRLLFQTVNANLGQVGFSELLDRLIATGVAKPRIQHFLKADPTGKGSILDQVTAELTNDLAEGMGVQENLMRSEDVKRIRKNPNQTVSDNPIDD